MQKDLCPYMESPLLVSAVMDGNRTLSKTGDVSQYALTDRKSRNIVPSSDCYSRTTTTRSQKTRLGLPDSSG